VDYSLQGNQEHPMSNEEYKASLKKIAAAVWEFEEKLQPRSFERDTLYRIRCTIGALERRTEVTPIEVPNEQ
jgi:hypothetical protein